MNCRNKDGDEAEKHDENDSCIEDKTLNTTPRFEDGACTHATEGTTETATSCLEQYKDNNGDAENDLNDSQGRKIWCKQRMSSFSY